jgi:membrane protein implicated in regulation of membrane protease activity
VGGEGMKYILSYVIMFVGVIFSIGVFIRWFVLYPDMSQLVLGLFLGLGMFILGYLYNWMKLTSGRIAGLQRQNDAIAGKMFGLEKEIVEESAKGVDRE